MADRLLACDWGTTRLRAWVLDDLGRPQRGATFDLGVGRLKPGEAADRFEQEVRPKLAAESLPGILCGMVGSELGWRSTRHIPCPARLKDLWAGRQQAAPDVWIVPGLTCAGLAGGPDVMRGEETQVFGWLARVPERRRARHLICHPGTHAKWILVEEGAIVRFATAMTGELFDLLRHHSVLRSPADPDDLSAFDEGVEVGRSGLLLSAAVFTLRGRMAKGQVAEAAAAAYLSGVLIGAEVAAMPQLIDPAAEHVSLIGAPALTKAYARALQACGVRSQSHDGDVAAQAGLFALADPLGSFERT